MRTRPFNLAIPVNLAINHQITRSFNLQIPRSRLCLS